MAKNHKLFDRVLWSYVPCNGEGVIVMIAFILLMGLVIGATILLSAAFDSPVPKYLGGSIAALMFVWVMRFCHRHS